MSATNRGTKRNIHDYYATPLNVIENLFNHIDLNDYGNKVLDPSSGNGNFGKVIRNLYPNKTLDAIEIREEEYNPLRGIYDNVVVDNYLEIDYLDKYDIIISNPPFSLSKEFCLKSFELLSENGVLIFLLRTAFLESKTRYDFWQENIVNRLYTLSKRPSFTNKGTDATSYSWFVWEKNSNIQEIKVI